MAVCGPPATSSLGREQGKYRVHGRSVRCTPAAGPRIKSRHAPRWRAPHNEPMAQDLFRVLHQYSDTPCHIGNIATSDTLPHRTHYHIGHIATSDTLQPVRLPHLGLHQGGKCERPNRNPVLAVLVTVAASCDTGSQPHRGIQLKTSPARGRNAGPFSGWSYLLGHLPVNLSWVQGSAKLEQGLIRAP